MDKAFEDILKGSVWENISEYLYDSLKELVMPDETLDVRKSLKHKINLCESIIACSKKTYPVTIGAVTLTEEQSALAKNAIKEAFIAEYNSLGMDKVLISAEEALRMLKMGIDDNWIRELYIELELNGDQECYTINYDFISRHIDSWVADLYADYIIEKSPYNTEADYPKFSEDDMKNVLSCLRHVLSVLPKGRPKNEIVQSAIELFFERRSRYDRDDVDDDIVGHHCITYFHPASKYIWLLYYPHHNEEYLTIYKCLDYWGIIDEDIKAHWEKNNSRYQEQSYIKKFVSTLKKKHPIDGENFYS